jgi:hypothetical protein
MAKTGTQIGGSQRGPGHLDQAKRNLGLHEDAVTRKPDDEEATAAGRTVEEEERAAREEAAREAATRPRRLEGEPVPRAADEDEDEDE